MLRPDRNYEDQGPAADLQSAPPRCGRCSRTDGDIRRYPVGNFHLECAEQEQADDDRYAKYQEAERFHSS